MSLSLSAHYCLDFKYFITGPIQGAELSEELSQINTLRRLVCMHFYARTAPGIRTQSALFSTFCIPIEQPEQRWYTSSIRLPENLTMVIAIASHVKDGTPFQYV